MNFTKKTWGNTSSTPLNYTSLNDLENRIYNGLSRTDRFPIDGLGRSLNSMTWASLSTIAKAGTAAANNIMVGDYKDTTCMGSAVRMQIAGIDTYYNTGDTAIGHHIDWISVGLLGTGHVMNSTNTNNGTETSHSPWLASEMYTWLNGDEVYGTLDSDLQSVIVTKRTIMEYRYSANGTLTDSTSWEWEDIGKLWLPTEFEVFGTSIWSDQTWGSQQAMQYPLFANNWKSRLKGKNSTSPAGRGTWWLASAQAGSSTDFCGVGSRGHAYYSAASASADWLSVPLCFRLA